MLGKTLNHLNVCFDMKHCNIFIYILLGGILWKNVLFFRIKRKIAHISEK